MRNILLLASTLPLVLGLPGCDSSKETGQESDADVDADADGDSDADSDADADAGPCSGWTGVQSAHTSWTYDYSDNNGYSGTIQNEVTDYNQVNGEVTFTSESDLSGNNYSMESTTVSAYVCENDGFYLLSMDTDYSMVVQGGTYSGWTLMAFNQPALMVPKSMSVGDTWTTVMDGTTTASQGQPTSFHTVTENEVTDSRSITVPAGRYDAMEVQQSGDATSTSYFADGVGSIKTEQTELTAYEP